MRSLIVLPVLLALALLLTAAAMPATLAVSPDPAAPGATLRVSGAGYDNSTWVVLRVTAPDGNVSTWRTGVWFDRHINCTISAGSEPGFYQVQALQTPHRKAIVKASASYRVE